jgi:hypothetical protein
MTTDLKIKLSHLFNLDKEQIIEQVHELCNEFIGSAPEVRSYIEITNDNSLNALNEKDDMNLLIKVFLSLGYSSIDEFTFSALRERYNENINFTCHSFGLPRCELINLSKHIDSFVQIINKASL